MTIKERVSNQKHLLIPAGFTILFWILAAITINDELLFTAFSCLASCCFGYLMGRKQ
jgi:hypothetical protein